MSERNPVISAMIALGANRYLNSQTEMADQMRRQSERMDEQNRLQQEHNLIDEERLELEKELVELNHRQNQIMEQQLEELQKRNLLAEVANNLQICDLEIKKKEIRKRELKTRIESYEQQIESRRRDIIFNIKKDLENSERPWETRVERFIEVANYRAAINTFGISTELSNSFEDKDLIRTTFDEIDTTLAKIFAELTKEEKDDIADIYKILEVNEELLLVEAEFELEQMNKKIEAAQKQLEMHQKKEEADHAALIEAEKMLRRHERSKPQ